MIQIIKFLGALIEIYECSGCEGEGFSRRNTDEICTWCDGSGFFSLTENKVDK